jgi:hypothetical protein
MRLGLQEEPAPHRWWAGIKDVPSKPHPAKRTEAASAGGFGSGAEGARTPDLFAASEALFQLSYSPGNS